MFRALLLDVELRAQVISSLMLLVVFLMTRAYAVARIAKWEMRSAETRRRVIVNVQNGALLFMVLGLVIVWATELRTLALSVVAILAAIVVATKEIITCISGGLFRTINNVCKVGDRIEINGIRGDVIDLSLFATQILEVGPQQQTHSRTGRAITIPNAIFLTAQTVNESFMSEFTTQNLQLPMKPEDNWKRAEELLLRAAAELCGPFIDDARAYMKRLQEDAGLDAPSPEPRVTLRVPEAGKLILTLRYPTPTNRRAAVEQAILRRYLELNVQPA